jgi:tRNA1(Val) A37 N6-methylase TrmN6
LLAASVPARAGDHVLDLGCGAGAALFCLAARVPGLTLTGIECQPAYAELALQNATDHGTTATVILRDIAAPPLAFREIQADFVIANPPYFQDGQTTAPQDEGRQIARSDTGDLSLWVTVAAKRLKPGGWLHMIQRAERLPDLLSMLPADMGSVEVLPVAPRIGRAARLVLLRARKGARGAFRLAAPLVLHAGREHRSDGDDYTPEVSAVLREAAPLPWRRQS